MNKEELLNHLRMSWSAIEKLMDKLNIDFLKNTWTIDECKRICEEAKKPLPQLSSQITAKPTDDDILDLADKSNVDLGIVMQYAAKVETLEQLTLYVEEYKRQQDLRQIRLAAKRKVDLEELGDKEQELNERISLALTREPISIAKLEKLLNITTPDAAKKLADWDDSGNKLAEVPDFLTQARRAISS